MTQPVSRPSPADAFAEALRVLRDALARVEALLAQAEAPSAADLAPLTQRIEALAAAQEALALRLDELADRLAALERRAGPTSEPVARAPDLRTIELVVTGVPGFQGLMDLQRALASLEGVRAAPVRSFQADEAALDITAETPPAPETLVAALRDVFARPVDVVDAPANGPIRLRIAPVQADL
ncbi:MAG TPA: hypothetical protein VNM43_09470 [Dehalococcoidia bacterium]|nr:hypothetical protein [Dehalococcoidia bacterium]